DGQIDFVRATNSSLKKPLPRTPSLQYLLGVDAEWRRFTGRMEIEGAGRQKRVAPLETATGGYTFFNAQLAYQFEPGLRFVIKGQNLTNVLARQHTSFVKKDAPLPGRDIRFYVQATF
ncbi:MAG TPA: TonB-dependent receptor, partial [Rhodospirillaceae bacterium]|nr:TonB-dependent receptor [Rhodospirillaceae bacterium]